MPLREETQEKKTLLPLGSVVRLKESQKRVMIIGFCQAKPEQPSKWYDYCGCLFPEGYLDKDHLFLFQHEQIEEVSARGLEDEEQQEFEQKLMEFYQKT